MKRYEPFSKKQEKVRRIFSYSVMLFLFLLIAAGITTDRANAQTYCAATVYDYTMTGSPGEPINYVEIGNATVDPYDYTYAAYVDRTSTILSVYAGAQYEAYFISGGRSDDGTTITGNRTDIKVYIDYNNDGQFSETSERVFVGQDNIIHEGFITIASGSNYNNAFGQKRMRIVNDHWEITDGTNAIDFIRGCNTEVFPGYNIVSYIGQVRDYTVNIIKGNDASITEIVAPVTPLKTGDNNITVVLQNNTGLAMTSAEIWWTVDGDETVANWNKFDWTGTLAANSSVAVTVGKYNFQHKKPVTSFTVKATVQKPNGYVDEDQTNDRAPDYTVFASLKSDTYTVGSGSDDDFPNIVALGNYLTAYGIQGTGDVNIKVKPGEYTGYGIFDNFINDANKITIESSSGTATDVIIRATPMFGDNYVLYFNNIDNVTLRNLTIYVDPYYDQGDDDTAPGSGASNGTAVMFEECENIAVTSVNITGLEDPMETASHTLLYFLMCNKLSVTANNFNYGAIGVNAFTLGEKDYIAHVNDNFFNGQSWKGIHLENEESTVTKSDVQIKNNEIKAYSGYAPNYGIVSINGSTISGNTISGLVGTMSDREAGIYAEHIAQPAGEWLLIFENTITGSQNVSGIIARAPQLKVYDNTINIDSDYYIDRAGLYIANSGSMDSPAEVYMNTVFIDEGTAFGSDMSHVSVYRNTFRADNNMDGEGGNSVIYAYGSSGIIGLNMITTNNGSGVNFESGNNIGFIYNSLNIQDPYNGALVLGQGEYNIYRNLIVNRGGGPAIVGNLGGIDFTSNENNYYSTGNVIANWMGTPYTVFTDWTNATGQDAGSVSIPVSYKDNNDLHLTLFDTRITRNYPLAWLDDKLRPVFENSDWDNEFREVYYFGVDNLNPAVKIVMQPEPVINCRGTANQFFETIATATLGSEPEYQWQKDGVDIPGAINSIYYIDTLDYHMSGVYRVVVSGSGGADPIYSDDILLYVMAPPVVTRQPDVVSVEEGGNVIIEIEAHIYGELPPSYWTAVQWYRGTTPLVNNTKIAGAQSSILTIKNVDASDYGDDYYAILTGYCGNARTEDISIVATPDIDIIAQPAAVEECEEGSAIFTVDAVPTGGGTSLNYQWMMNNQPLTDGIRLAGTATNQLTISDLGTNDDGDYSVMVTVEPGGKVAYSDVASLRVKMAPYVTVQPLNVDIAKNTPFTLEVTAEGEQPLTYAWYHNGILLSGANMNVLDLPGDQANEGEYYVEISNDCGLIESDRVTVTLTQGGISSVDEFETNGYKLYANNPNPFESNTTIDFFLPDAASVNLVLMDEAGREIALLASGLQPQGLNSVEINAKDMNLSSGVYYYTLTVNNLQATKKMVLIK